jgi:hypothetical protein
MLTGKLNGLMCAGSARSSPRSVSTKVCSSQATAFDLLARGSGGDEAPELRAVWTRQRADDLLLDHRRQPGSQCVIHSGVTSRISASISRRRGL